MTHVLKETWPDAATVFPLLYSFLISVVFFMFSKTHGY